MRAMLLFVVNTKWQAFYSKCVFIEYNKLWQVPQVLIEFNIVLRAKHTIVYYNVKQTTIRYVFFFVKNVIRVELNIV